MHAMKRFRLSRDLRGRSSSTASEDLPSPSKPPSKGLRTRSISDVFDHFHRDSSPSREGIPTVCYMGFAQIDDPKNAKEIQGIIKTVKETTMAQKPVKFTYKDGLLSVLEMSSERLLVCQLFHIAQCVHGFSDCFAVAFSGGHYGKQCHVFQAKSSREAADIVQALHKASRTSSKQRGLSKSRRPSDLNIAVSFTKPKVSGDSPKLGMHCMEDEGEVLEIKRVSQFSRGESKRTIIRTSGETTSSASSLTGSIRVSSSDSISSAPWLGGVKATNTPPKEKRRTRRGTGRSGEREFTRQDRVNQLLNAVERVVENNTQLRQACSNTHPASNFQDALYAMHSDNTQLLKNYLTKGVVTLDTYDSSGNSLLHYAVALDNIEVIKILCDHMAHIDSSGWNDCRPLHRAAAEGNKAVLQTLLLRGANVNSTDNMGRSPLHMSAGKLEFMECSIALLEYGAQIMTNDVLGLRPYDLCPELKETQNRLVTSTCEAFASAHLKDSAPLFSSVSTPMSSPASTRPSSVISGDHMRSHDVWTHPQREADLIDEVRRDKALRLKAFSKRSRFKRWKISRSIGNLSELQEADEDEMLRRARLEKLKFPSEFNLNSSYYSLEENAGTIFQFMNKMIHAGKQGGKRNESELDAWSPGTGLNHSQLSLSEPNLHELSLADGGVQDASPEPRPLSALSGEQYAHLGRREWVVAGKGRSDSAASQSSTGTLVKEGSSDIVSSVHQVSRAFEHLQEDLRRASLKREGSEVEEEAVDFVKLPASMQTCLRLPVQLQPDASPLMERRSTAETAAIFNELIAQLQGASEELELPSHTGGSQTNGYHHRNKDNVSPENDVAKTSPAGVLPDPVMCDGDDTGSDAHETMDTAGPARQREIQNDKKPKGSKLGVGIKRITSPFRLRRRTSLDTSSEDSESYRSPLKRKMSLPEAVIQSALPRSLSGGRSLSSDLVPPSASSSVTSLDGLYVHYQRSGVEGGMSEPVTSALRVMVTLSTNKECLPTLISYICLPKCVSRLTNLAQSVSSSPEVLSNIATLMQNLYESGGAEGKKNALGSGVLDLTIKLLHSRDPVPDEMKSSFVDYVKALASFPGHVPGNEGTCLSLLNGLLVSEDDNDYLRTIIRIPSGPLLSYLEPYESDIDSGFENQRRDTSISGTTRSSSDYQGQPTSDDGSRPSSGLEVPGLSGVTAGILGGKFRASSFNSETSESSSARSFVSPTLRGHMVTYFEARRIVLKMLAVSSSHSKMQHELSNYHAIALLSDCLSDSPQENVTNAAIALANISQNMNSHDVVGVMDKLKVLLGNGPRPRYHAARALVYLGELDMGGTSLFEPTGYETDVLMTSDDDGHVYARGATLEKCVEVLTDNPSQLWGGFNLALGPQSPPAGSLSPKATKEQILTFFLTTYQSFMHPVILMRLLLHRISSQEPDSPFNWSLLPDRSTIPSTPPSTPLPPIEANVLNLIGRWLEHFSSDFHEHPQLRQSVVTVIQRLRLAKGPYTHHTHRLRSLLQDVGRPRSELLLASTSQKRTPHHENLYKLCKQMISGGHLPVTQERAVFMAGLQLHTEAIADPSLLGKGRRNFTMRLRSSLPVSYTKVKHIAKRVRNQVLEFENLSERNAKHLYIERCQAMPGYDCTFFSIRVPSAGRFRKGPVVKQLLGVSSKNIVFLDEKTKDLVTRYNLRDVQNIRREETDPCSLLVSLEDGSSHRFQVESTSMAWEIANVMEQCLEGEDWHIHEQSDERWSDSLPTIQMVFPEQGCADSDESSPSSSESSPERENTPPVPDRTVPANEIAGSARGNLEKLESLVLPGMSLSHHTHTPHTLTPAPSSLAHLGTTPNGHVDHLSGTLRIYSREDSIATDLSDQVVSPEDNVPFCDCPPDPEIPRGLNLKDPSISDLLKCPLEVARQMTLIAHKRLCLISSVELLHKVNLIPKPSSLQHRSNTSPHSTHPPLIKPETAVERLAFRFNQVGNWVAHSILQYQELEDRVEALQQFITIAKHCMDFRNYSSVMAIVAGLGSSPIRRLHRTWEGVSKQHSELYKHMDAILDTRGSYKNYREKLVGLQTPAVPYVGVFLTDLTFICEGNPDFLRGGLINVHKRRQVYKTLEELRHFQQDQYNFHTVPDIQEKLLSYKPIGEDELHSTSHQLEPKISRSQSQTPTGGRNKSGAGVSTTQNFSIFRALTRSGSLSSSNLFRT